MHGGQDDGNNDNSVDDVLSTKHIVRLSLEIGKNMKRRGEENRKKHTTTTNRYLISP